MDVALVHPFLYVRGGAERVVLKIAERFNAKIYCSIYEPENTFSEFREFDVEVLKTRFLRAVPSFLPKRIRDSMVAGYSFYTAKLGDFDVINAHNPPSEWIRNRNTPVVWYCYSPNREVYDLHEWKMSQRNLCQSAMFWSAGLPYRMIEPQIARKIEHIFAISGGVRDRVREYLNVESEVLYPGMDFDEFYCAEYKKYFYYPSRITPEKRFEYAIEAFKKFKEKNPGWELVISGFLKGDRPEHVEYYLKIKRMLGNDGRILLGTPWKEVLRLYSECYSVLFTPRNEDFGYIPLEAMASCKPCIAVNEGGSRELIEDGVDGFLVNSVEDMAERMAYLASDPGIAERIGAAGQKKVREKFGWDRFLTRFEKVFKEVSKQNSQLK